MYHKLGGLKQKRFISLGSGGQRSKTKALAGPSSLLGLQGRTLPRASQLLLVTCRTRRSLACTCIVPVSVHVLTEPASRCVPLCPSFPRLLRALIVGLGSLLILSDLLDHISKEPTYFQQRSHSQVPGLGLQHSYFPAIYFCHF